MSLFNNNKESCNETILAFKDAIELFRGKWKLYILQVLSTSESLRFKDLQEAVVGISPKVLSKELYELEQNRMITRTVNNTKPVTVSYSLTNHAEATKPVITALIDFGMKHRQKIKGY